MKRVLFALTLVAMVPAVASKECPPNVLFVAVDDMSALLPSYGNAEVIAPNLDRLAARGRLFENAYTQVALCNPSRASLMTGVRPSDLKIWTNGPHFRGRFPRIKTLPQLLRESGYHTVGIGKIYHNWGQSLEGDAESWSEPQVMHWGPHYSDWHIPGRIYEMHHDIRKGPAVQMEDVPDEAYIDGRIARAAVTKLQELQEVPFFLAVGFWKPHLPYNAPQKYWDLYDRESLAAPVALTDSRGIPAVALGNSAEARSYTDVPRDGPISERKQKELRHGYLAGISFVDAQIGRVLDELDRLALTENTLVVFWSDHGYHAGELGHWGKWTNFEIGTRVPLIMAGPGVSQPGVATDAIVELLDLYPTMAELCGVELPNQYPAPSGRSIANLLQDPGATAKGHAISQTTRPINGDVDFEYIGTSVRVDGFRYTKWIRTGDGEQVAEEFYDLGEDTGGINNVIATSMADPMVERLREMIRDF